MNRCLAFVLTLLVDFILLCIGAAAISFLSVAGVFAFLIEFYFIRTIHHNVFEFLTKEKGLKNVQPASITENNDTESPCHITKSSSILQNETDNPVITKKKLKAKIIIPVKRYVTYSKNTIRNTFVLLLSLLGIAVISLILLTKPSNNKFGGYLYPIYENGLYGYIDSIGNKIIEPQFLWCSTFSNNKALVITDTVFREVDDSVDYYANERDSVDKKFRLFAKYGYIDRSGKFVIPPKYICYVNIANNETDFDIKDCSHVFQLFTFRNGRALAYDTLTWKVGYIDESGSIVIPQKYYYAEPFSDSLAIVYEKKGKPHSYNNMIIVPGYLRAGYIDINGDSVTECKYELLTTFNSDRGIGVITKLYFQSDSIDSYSIYNILLNEKGASIDTLPMYNRYFSFGTDGVAVCKQVLFFNNGGITNDPSYEFVNKDGEILEPLAGLSKAYIAYYKKRDDVVQVWPKDVDMADVTFFEDGLAGVTPDHENWYFIDKYLYVHGNDRDPAYEDIQGFCNSLCAVKKNGKWGFVNRKIEEVIPFKYDSCGVAYPYLEEVFDLNNDGSVNKKYWINRFDSVVWESEESNSVANIYSNKNKIYWGQWSQTEFNLSKEFDIRYVYGLITLIFIVLVIYFIFRHDYKDIKFYREYITFPVSILSLFLCIYCAHAILNYLLDDYTNITEKSIRNNTSNIIRKNSVNFKCIRYEDERFWSKDSIGNTPKHSKWLEFGIGTLPSGKFVSTYVGTNNDNYLAGYRKVLKHGGHWVPNNNILFDTGSIVKNTIQSQRNRRDRKWEEYSYIDNEPVYYNYTWYYALSTFDISDRLSRICNEDTIYSDYLKDIEAQLAANYGYEYAYTNVDGKKALRYSTDDGTPIERVIFCANGRAYVMETKSIDKLNEHSKEACSKIKVNNIDLAEKDNQFIILSIVGLIIGIFLLAMILIWHFNGKTLNNKAHKLYLYSILSTVINMILFCYAIYAMYVLFEISLFVAYLLILALSSCMIVSIPLVAYYRSKEKDDCKDFIIPSWIKKFVYSKISSDIHKKLFLTFVIYPLMIISLIPCGIIMLVYIIPAFLISIIILLVTKWINRLTNDKRVRESQNVVFKDYYSILNVPFDANQNDINIAYNSKTSFLKQFVNTKSFDRTEYQDVQEAYRILSTPHIKFIYDNEYQAHLVNEDGRSSSFTDQELVEVIKNYRKDIVFNSVRNDKFNKIYFIIVVIITAVIFIIKCSSDTNAMSSTVNYVPTTLQ